MQVETAWVVFYILPLQQLFQQHLQGSFTPNLHREWTNALGKLFLLFGSPGIFQCYKPHTGHSKRKPN